MNRMMHVAQSVKLLALAALLVAGSCGAAIGEARVIDGGTLEVGAETIRLWGIDAREGGQTCVRTGTTYDCGAEALAALSRLVSGRVQSARDGRAAIDAANFQRVSRAKDADPAGSDG